MEPADERRYAAERLHVLNAICTALERRADLLDVVGDSGSADEAVARLQAEWGFTEVQALAALDLQVGRFAGRDRAHIAEERNKLVRRLAELPN